MASLIGGNTIRSDWLLVFLPYLCPVPLSEYTIMHAGEFMQTIVALDLETTGLDPRRDAIIEIGATRFRGTRIEGEYRTFVNPGCPIPPVVTELTGITATMVAGAPRIQDILTEFESFVADSPILGHNVGFDLGFLHRHGLFKDNQALDTMDLASVLLPSSNRYGLTALAMNLGIPITTAHRALDDAITTRNIFLRFYDLIRDLPPELLSTIAHLGENIDWGGGWLFETAIEELFEEGLIPDQIARPEFPGLDEEYPPLEPAEERKPLNGEELAAILEPGGAFARSFPAFEHRPQQINMLESVAAALSESQHLLVEAGTGTGKSMAYLIPAFAWATLNGERVVISTNTINLQDQLYQKDIPALREALGEPLRAAILKGRSNYLCPRRLDAMLTLGPRSPYEMRVLAKILVWLQQGGSGDRSEINLAYGERPVWTAFSAEGEDCSPEQCAAQAEGRCPYYRARRAAENAHVVIINHALLLADIAVGNRVLPDFNYLIVDEAHHLESATTNGLSFSVRETDFLALFKDLGNERSGLLHQILSVSRKVLKPAQHARIQTEISSVASYRDQATIYGQDLFKEMARFLERREGAQSGGAYSERVRIEASTRTLPDWSEIEIAWDELRQPLSSMTSALTRIGELLQDMLDAGVPEIDNLAVSMQTSLRSLEMYFSQLDQFLFEPDPGQIYWLEIAPGQSQVTLHMAPLNIGPLVERFLWHEKESVIMTSATLTTGGDFEYIRQRLKADDADELALGSPFDYESSTLLYLVNDIAEPAERQNYQRGVEESLIRLCKATLGRTLALFTSYAQLQRTANAISPALESEGIRLLTQQSGASRHSLLQAFREEEKAVLLGTRSFWEGVDIPGDSLSALVIVRLPFHVPNDPIIAARAETFEYPFDEYMVPEAILRFRQGFGRLIRTQSDRGIVVILDRRVMTKKYGRGFLDSLPQCTVREGKIADLPRQASRWLGL